MLSVHLYNKDMHVTELRLPCVPRINEYINVILKSGDIDRYRVKNVIYYASYNDGIQECQNIVLECKKV